MTTKNGKKKQKHPETKTGRLKKKFYFNELDKLQLELVKMHEWVKKEGLRVVVVFEGRDAAGKGGVIKRITQRLNPRICRVVALGVPTEREKTQWYFQRYVSHLPAAGEMVLFDRSWYNRAGVERVMGFCTDEEYWDFLRNCPRFEEMLIQSGIILIKYWFSRSFLKPSIQEREKTAELKIVATAENLNHFLRMLADEGFEKVRQDIIERKRIIIVVCDDSVVRGTQIKSNLAPKLRMSYESGEIKAEIHVRVSFPEILSHCVWGKTTKKGETLAEMIPDKKQRAEALGVESVFYNTLDDLEQVLEVPLRHLCIACAIKNPA